MNCTYNHVFYSLNYAPEEKYEHENVFFSTYCVEESFTL